MIYSYYFFLSKRYPEVIPEFCQGDKITHYPLPITHYPLPITHYPLPITHYPLPITHYPLPITHYPQSRSY
ncbi:hypothetical protein BJP34_07570 [Moorena producens PAL-8-15-08-1]|uniref:Uncharacterized protein n=1 Tax=Moorena producens PAL-8-15-08-1 TaxID=1458985 RepID=A0A1D8TP01_9CYAN|nr:hypothetical protein BJP34_07570 [Moorena producens PAL-8-15-08-1]